MDIIYNLLNNIKYSIALATAGHLRNNINMFLKAKLIFYFVLTLFILYCIYLSAFFVLNNEVHITNDIGRDFLLLQELDQNKIVLIGARANTQGVFHGPLWTYLNYPAFLVGKGNPVAIAWFWIFLEIIFLISSFFIFKKIFNYLTALLAIALLAVIMTPHANSLFGQLAGFYFMPLFLFTIYKYAQNQKVLFLSLHFLFAGIIIQMNIGAGLLLVLLSLILSTFFIIKNKKYRHFFSFLILPLCLINFVLFDLRHEFHISKALINMGKSSQFIIPFNTWIQNRIDHLISMQIPSPAGQLFSLIVFLFIMIFTFLEIKKGTKQKRFFLLFIFYYFGYMLLSYFNKGIILIDHVYMLSALSVVWLAALTKGSYKIIFIPLILLITYFNFLHALDFINKSRQSFIGRSPDSWVSLQKVAGYITDQQQKKEFGYFVYSPDSYAYQQRYAMSYAFQNAHASSFEYIKKPVTYIIAAPPPVNNPYMKEDWWIKNEANISSPPAEKKSFPGGYTVRKYDLSPMEQKIPHDPNIELGLHFR